MEKLNGHEVSQLLIDLIESASESEFLEDEFNMKAETFADAGVMSIDDGIVLNINGREFQITVVRSK